uniref:Putative family s59 unassigned peptidase n=1 Tax=Ixodes ricinus TaxID=34613 RepID=A0A6B0V5I6_IXORI
MPLLTVWRVRWCGCVAATTAGGGAALGTGWRTDDVSDARSGTLTGGATDNRSRRAECVRERAVLTGALVEAAGCVGVVVSTGGGGTATGSGGVGWRRTTLPSCARESCTCCRGDTITVGVGLLVTTCTVSVTAMGAGACGAGASIITTWFSDVGEDGGVDSGMMPCSLSNSARFTGGALFGFSTTAGCGCGCGCGGVRRGCGGGVCRTVTAGCCCCRGTGCTTVVVVTGGWWVTMVAVGAEDTTVPPADSSGPVMVGWW